MQKTIKYSWKDSNLQLLSSKDDRTLKKSSAETEPAWNAVNLSESPQLFVWRIEKFKVVSWPKQQYGEFYEGDSYIVLNSYFKEKEYFYDIHFWIGKYSTQDEYGTAAYKTVELDTLLEDKSNQHREVQHFESDLFKTYFSNIIYLKGGCETGFRHVNTAEYNSRLLHVRREKQNIIVSEVASTRKHLKSENVFIFDTGAQIFQWIGKYANKDEKYRAQQFVQQLNSDRNGRSKIEVLDEEQIPEDHEFYTQLSDSDPNEDDTAYTKLPVQEKKLFRISDARGSLRFEEIKNMKKLSVNENDVFLIDNGQVVYVYVGEKSSPNERKNALIYGHNYLKKTEYPQVPITVVSKNTKGKIAELFDQVIGN